MKKGILSIVSLIVCVATALLAFGCSSKTTIITSQLIGNDLPEDISVNNSINSKMTALEMYLVGVKNYLEANYVGSLQDGDVITKMFGLKPIQGVTIKRIRSNGKVFMDSYSVTKKGAIGDFPNIKIGEEIIVEDSAVRYRKAEKKNIDIVDSKLVVKKWNDVEKHNRLSDFLKNNPNDPTRINMFVVNSETVVEQSTPILDKKNKVYSFSLTLDTKKGMADYLPVMKKMVSDQGLNADISFNKFKLNVVMWDNGLIKYIESDEQFYLKMGILDGNAGMVAKTSFTYNQDELSYESHVKF